MKAIVATAIALTLFPALANARGEDLVNCRFSDGQYIPASLCQRYRNDAIEARKHRAEQQEQLRQQQVAQEERQRKKDEEAAEFRRQWDAKEIERQKQQAARQAKSDAEDAKYKRDEARQEKLAAEKTKAKKERCGADYGTPQVGMTLARAQECVGNFQLVSQLNRSDGVVSTYRAGRIHLHVMSGKIGAWDRY